MQVRIPEGYQIVRQEFNQPGSVGDLLYESVQTLASSADGMVGVTVEERAGASLEEALAAVFASIEAAEEGGGSSVPADSPLAGPMGSYLEGIAYEIEENISVNGAEAFLLAYSPSAGEMRCAQLFVAMGDGRTSVVSLAVPADVAESEKETLDAILASVEV